MTPVPKTIYLIVVKSITNKGLIGAGWCVGMPVKEEDKDGEYFSRLYFEPGYDVYVSYDAAQKMMEGGNKHFAGVEFEVVPFRMLDQRLQNLL